MILTGKTDLFKKILVIGSGPIVIGQAAEFDYSGTQACKALKEEGIKVILVNPNPATIQTDPDVADEVLFEPLTSASISKILLSKQCDGIIGSVSGQTGLNIIYDLYKESFFEKHNIKVLGTQPQDINVAEDRECFNRAMASINEPIAPWKIYHDLNTIKEDFKIGDDFPYVVRSSFTLGGSGSGLAMNYNELLEIASDAFKLSKSGIIIEKSLVGEEEFEFELLRDHKDNCIVVCSMENLDPMGVHTGDSVVISPVQTLSNREYQILRNAAIKIVRALNIIGACNIQFSWNIKTRQYHVIEVNPRTSRSSALASKATGYPIARFSTKIALGNSLDSILNPVTGKSYASFEPSMDYVAVKIPVWPFEKFKKSSRRIGTSMHSTGEVMGLGRTLEEAFMKAFYSAGFNFNIKFKNVKKYLTIPNDLRIPAIFSAIDSGIDLYEIAKLTGWNVFFVNKLKNIVNARSEVVKTDDVSYAVMKKAKTYGIGDEDIAHLTHRSELEIRDIRKKLGIIPVYKAIDTCSGEYDAQSPYYYSTYTGCDNEPISMNNCVVVIGSGPIRIGQGIEFDYSSVHASEEIRAEGYKSIMINNNPETVSTDFDLSDRLYFEPVNFEHVANVADNERPTGIIVQFGGQTSINIAKKLADYIGKIKILGTSIDAIEITEDRHLFSKHLDKYNIKKPMSLSCTSSKDLLKNAEQIGYPVLIRPSYIIGGSGVEIFYNPYELEEHIDKNIINYDNPVLIESFFENATELDVDIISDGSEASIIGILEHIEEAGVHSGDATMVYPPIDVDYNAVADLLIDLTKSLRITGLINYQIMVKNRDIFMIEANPRASRTIPFLSKAIGIKFARIATALMLGHKLKEYDLNNIVATSYYVKVPIFPFKRFQGIDYLLGPEMKSTGEVMGIGKTIEEALWNAYESSLTPLPKSGAVLLTLNESDKIQYGNEIAKMVIKSGLELYATPGLVKHLNRNGINAKIAYKIGGMRKPTCSDLIKNGIIKMVINTPKQSHQSFRDGYVIRKAAIDFNIPLFTNLRSARYAISLLNYLNPVLFNQ